MKISFITKKKQKTFHPLNITLISVRAGRGVIPHSIFLPKVFISNAVVLSQERFSDQLIVFHDLHNRTNPIFAIISINTHS